MIQNKVEQYWSQLSDIERYQLLNIALSYFTELPIDIDPRVILKYIIDTAKYTDRYNNGG
jgi:hypothetical protein